MTSRGVQLHPGVIHAVTDTDVSVVRVTPVADWSRGNVLADVTFGLSFEGKVGVSGEQEDEEVMQRTLYTHGIGEKAWWFGSKEVVSIIGCEGVRGGSPGSRGRHRSDLTGPC